MDFFSIKNFERYQHYKNRNPPWIKLYYDLLDDEDFLSLSIVSRHHYMTLLLVASRKHNKIPLDLDYLKKVMRLDAKPVLTELFQRGFCVASTMLAECYQDASASVSVSVSDSSSEGEKIVKKRGNGLVAFPQDWKLDMEKAEGWRKFGLNPAIEFAAFRDHALTTNRRCADWEAAFRNWCRKSIAKKEERHDVRPMR